MVDLSESGLMGSSALGEDVDPMSYVSNLVDAMLVFACGLLLALVTMWNLDLTNVSQIQEEQMTEVSDIETITDAIKADGSSYDELGMVYRDPETGKMYLIEE